ncbi:lipoprotein [Halobacillus sp. B23F22_1]
MKKLLAVLGVVALLASAAGPVVYDTADDNYPKPLVVEQV